MGDLAAYAKAGWPDTPVKATFGYKAEDVLRKSSHCSGSHLFLLSSSATEFLSIQGAGITRQRST